MGTFISSVAPPATYKLLETLNPSATSAITTGTLAAYDNYMVFFETVTFSASGTMLIQFNLDTGLNYNSTWINNTTIVRAAGANGIYAANYDTVSNLHGQLIVGGKTAAVAGGILGAIPQYTPYVGSTGVIPLGGNWVGGNAVQVTKMTFTIDTGTMTGTIKIYGITGQ